MPYPMMVSSQAEGDVLRERERQHYEEGFRAEHDDSHVEGELAQAAATYAVHAAVTSKMMAQGFSQADINVAAGGRTPGTWPWARTWWKPKDRRRDLVRAAALIIAEIERIDRAEARAKLEGRA